MNKTQFDRLFDAAFEASHSAQDSMTVDHRASWDAVRQQLNARHRKSGRRSALSKLAIIAASLVLGAFLFGNERAVKAFQPLYATLKEYPSGIMGFFFGRDESSELPKAKTAPPPAHLEGLSFEQMNDSTLLASVTEAKAAKLLSFQAPVFGYLPAGYSFDHASLYFYDGRDKADQAIYAFKSEDGSFMTILIRKSNTNSHLGFKNTLQGVNVQQIPLGDGFGILTSLDGNNSLEAAEHDLYITLSGRTSSEDLVRMYENMRTGD
ncbi:DUF4367 domain-containing protein [Cohnella boryungensis]|uniref:DUF4367 domain-containing protein n=1 Tax=Cohnella boryungensis TaxID=768479 RepID=A0ABV8S406_9BACL